MRSAMSANPATRTPPARAGSHSLFELVGGLLLLIDAMHEHNFGHVWLLLAARLHASPGPYWMKRGKDNLLLEVAPHRPAPPCSVARLKDSIASPMLRNLSSRPKSGSKRLVHRLRGDQHHWRFEPAPSAATNTPSRWRNVKVPKFSNFTPPPLWLASGATRASGTFNRLHVLLRHEIMIRLSRPIALAPRTRCRSRRTSRRPGTGQQRRARRRGVQSRAQAYVFNVFGWLAEAARG